MFCPDCFAEVYLVVDGKEMTEDELLHLRVAPKSIERKLVHKKWCPSHDNLVRSQSDYGRSYWFRNS